MRFMEFKQKIQDFFDGKLKDVSKNARTIAEERAIEKVGEQLKKSTKV